VKDQGKGYTLETKGKGPLVKDFKESFHFHKEWGKGSREETQENVLICKERHRKNMWQTREGRGTAPRKNPQGESNGTVHKFF